MCSNRATPASWQSGAPPYVFADFPKMASEGGAELPRSREVIMEIHMHSHHYAGRMPDWRAAVIGGCVAGAVFLVLELLAMWAIGRSPWGPPRMIAAIVLGRDALAQPATISAGI